MSLLTRIKNLWFLSTISREDIRENPNSFMTRALHREEMGGMAYIAGLSDEEQSFSDTLNADGKDTTLT